jgi:hypothetical protein
LFKIPALFQVLGGLPIFVQLKLGRVDADFCPAGLHMELYDMFRAVLDGKIKHSDIVPLLAEMFSKLV